MRSSRWSSVVIMMALAGCPVREPLDQTQPEVAMCAFDAPADPDRAVLATVLGRDVVFVRGDGSTRTIARLGGDRELAWLNPAVTERDGFVLVTAELDAGGGTTEFEAMLLDVGGHVLWQGVQEPGIYQAFLGEAGMVALLNWAGESAVARPDGTRGSLGTFRPLGGPLADGSVAVTAQGWGPSTCGWMKPGDEALTPTAYEREAGGDPVLWNGSLVYVALDAGVRIVVVERPDDVRTIAIPVADTYYCTLGVPNADGWIVVREGWQGLPMAAVHLETGATRPLSVVIPEGMRTFNYGWNPLPGIDGEGALLLGLRDDYEAALYRSVDGIDWKPVGATVSQVMAVEADSRGGTYAILGTSARYSWEDWPTPPADRVADVVGDALQIVRPSDGVIHMLPAPFDLWISATVNAPMMSEDGACVAYWDAAADRMPSLHVLEVGTGQRFDLGEPVVGMSPAAVAWIGATSATR